MTGASPLDRAAYRSTQSRRLCAGFGIYVLLGGLISFSGWMLNSPRLTDWFDTGISVMPNTAVAASSAGAALLFVSSGRHAIAALFSALVLFLGAATILEHLTGLDLVIDRFLLFGHTWGRTATMAPGRMGPPGAMSWTLTGMGLLLVATARGRAGSAVPFIALLVTAISGFSLIGYTFDVRVFYTIPWATAIALQTATFIFAMGLGLMACVPERDPMRALLDDTIAGVLARRALPLMVLVTVVLSLFRLQGERSGWYDSEAGTALLVLTLIAALSGVFWWGVVSVRSRELELRRAQEDLKRTTDQLAEADRRKDEFLAMLAHELRNPLAPIVNALGIMKLAPGDQALAEKFGAMMERQIRHMVRLIDDLMDVSRITRNRLELRRERMELTPLLQDAIESCRPMLDEAGHDLEVRVSDEPIVVDGDPVRLAQVLGNLIANSCRYTPPGGRIRLEVQRLNDDAVVRVKDNGIGIPAHMLPKVFDLFTQVDRSRERSRGGLGVGLTLAKRLVEMHDGTLTADSPGPDQGSEFTIRLPVPADVLERPEPLSSPGWTGANAP